MRRILGVFSLALLSGCQLGAGAGLDARMREAERAPIASCNDFESCDVAYQIAEDEAARCHADGEECVDADRNASAVYAALHEQTERELSTLRSALQQDARQASANEPPYRGAVPCEPDAASESAGVPERGNSWFSEGPPAFQQ